MTFVIEPADKKFDTHHCPYHKHNRITQAHKND